jgi:hypothetical protein
MTLLLLSGRAGCGKDAAASLLMEEVGFTRFAFADFLKRDVAAQYGLPLDLFHTAAKDQPLPAFKGKTPRTLLLDHARIARSVDLDVYARQGAAAIKAAVVWKAPPLVVLSEPSVAGSWAMPRTSGTTTITTTARSRSPVPTTVTKPPQPACFTARSALPGRAVFF